MTKAVHPKRVFHLLKLKFIIEIGYEIGLFYAYKETIFFNVIKPALIKFYKCGNELISSLLWVCQIN